MEHTPSQTIGPFFHLSLTVDQAAGCLAGPETKGERIRLACKVLDGDALPVDDAMIELWQADAGGRYDHPEDPRRGAHDSAFRGFGRLATNAEGACIFESVKPGRVPASDGALQAPHINVGLFARGLLKRAVTRIYFSGNPANQSDPVLALVPENRRDTLMARPDAGDAARWSFDIHLCGERETVFFDL
ncbi:MAG TPA: protocatechuate 3,4-dioxygenase subunit alpha [Bryobacteraceae bacterium]|nr:protocatechuate 3,4-dioxygenase subunit alpha [Bryobacteraceae bacterium]